jgi:hypothetical protein
MCSKITQADVLPYVFGVTKSAPPLEITHTAVGMILHISQNKKENTQHATQFVVFAKDRVEMIELQPIDPIIYTETVDVIRQEFTY